MAARRTRKRRPDQAALPVRLRQEPLAKSDSRAHFSGRKGVDVLSAGIASEADTPLDDELVCWADRIFVMEQRHRTAVRRQFRSSLGSTPIVCLGIPDRYRYMDPHLIDLLERKMTRFTG
jgi:predicted protein tyrosine phosphatase